MPYQGKSLAGILRKPVRRRAPAGAGVRLRARLLQGGDRRLRAAVPRARHRDAGVRRPRPGRRRIRFRHPRRLRGGGEGGARLRRDAARSQPGAHRHRRHQPRRLLRAARGGLREAHQGLPRARRPLRLGRVLGRMPDLTREAFRVRSKCATLDDALEHAATLTLRDVAAAHHLPDLHHERPPGPHRARPPTPSGSRARSRARSRSTWSRTATTSPTTAPTAGARRARTGWRSSCQQVRIR